MFKNLIISPPFGNIVNFDFATSICGTYTAHKSDGMVCRYLKTLRPICKNNKLSWVNSIGLRNPGIKNINLSRIKQKILSISLINEEDMVRFFEVLKNYIINQNVNLNAIEINISCPNAKIGLITNDEIALLKSLGLEVIIKVPPIKRYLEIIEFYKNSDVKYFHLFNSFPCSKGGLSGVVIKRLYFKLIKRAKESFGESIEIIAGGGIQSIYDIVDYRDIGVNYYSISSLFFHPMKFIKFFNDYKNIEYYENTAL